MTEFRIGSHVRVITRRFNNCPETACGTTGRVLVPAANASNCLLVTMDSSGYEFPFKADELEAYEPTFRVGQIVRIESAAYPSWNGDAVVRSVHDLAFIVTPITGKYTGVDGYFPEFDLKPGDVDMEKERLYRLLNQHMIAIGDINNMIEALEGAS